jgi:hypothetical protein
MTRVTRNVAVMVVAIALMAPSLFAQDPTAGQEPSAAAGNGQRGSQPPRPRPYDQVVTREAKTDKGLFDVHKLGETYYYEIPKAMLGKVWKAVAKSARIAG